MKEVRLKARTCEVIIDYSKCKAPDCGFECIKADRLYGRSVLGIRGGKPVPAVSPEAFERRCNECLACELYCPTGAIKVVVPL